MAVPVPTAPALRDPVVIYGAKYRIKSIDERELVGGGTTQLAMCRQSFAPRDTRWVRVDQLLWDRVAGVWRPEAEDPLPPRHPRR